MLISVAKAEQAVLRNSRSLPAVSLSLAQVHGCILAENIFADRDQPATDRSSMDGIAISFKAWKAGAREFILEGTQKAGIPGLKLKKRDGCFEIMTGAVVPMGCDCVIPVEAIERTGSRFSLAKNVFVSSGSFVRKRASEYKKGSLLIAKSTKLNATHIAVIASTGKTRIKVFSPKIAVIGTGDEVVPVAQAVKPHQVRRSNAAALDSLFRSHGFFRVAQFHLRDNVPQLTKSLKNILKDHDILVLSGGVSMGKFDLVPAVLANLGVKKLFHKVSEKPGNPFWFGLTKDKKPVFALPGNPVSTLVCATRYALPYLQKSCGVPVIQQKVSLAKSIKQNPRLTLFLPVNLTDGKAECVTFAGSGDYGAISKSAGFIETPKGKGDLAKNSKVRYFSW